MKVEIKYNKKNELKYPCLMISKFGPIVLVTSCKEYGHMSGTVVANNPVVGMMGFSPKKYKIGEYNNTWVRSVFEVYTGSITLSNE